MKHIKKTYEFCNSEDFIKNKLHSKLSQIDFSKLPLDVVKRQTKNLSLYNTHKVFGNPLSGNIGQCCCLLEGITKTFPLAVVKRHIEKKYEPSIKYKALPEHIKQLLGETKWLWKIASSPINAFNSVVSFYDLEDWQFQIHNNPDGTQTHAIVIIPDIDENILLMDKTMVCFGYYRSCNISVKSLFPSVKNMDMWVVLQYEQKIQEFVNNKIRKEDYLYHVSPSYLEHKILKNGLVPKSKNKQFNFPDRIYMLMGGVDDVKYGLRRVANMLYNTKELHGDNKFVMDNEYISYKIDISKIPSNVNFSIDYNFLPLSIFTADNIPPKALEIIDRYTID